MNAPILLDICLLILVSLTAITDLYNRRIPNLLLLTGLFSAILIYLLSTDSILTLSWGLLGAATGLLIFMPLYCLRGMAAGDVKLMATVGFYNTPYDTLYIALVAVCIGGLMSLAVMVANGRNRTIPYGVAITGGTWFVIAQHYHLFT